jgi:hypothetical protein
MGGGSTTGPGTSGETFACRIDKSIHLGFCRIHRYISPNEPTGRSLSRRRLGMPTVRCAPAKTVSGHGGRDELSQACERRPG